MNIEEKINKILTNYDPAGVIVDEKISNEYLHESRRIVELLNLNGDYENLSKEIRKIFIEYFNESIAGPEEKYLPIAKEIIESLKQG